MSDLWVLDATMADETEDAMGAYPFCPLEGDPHDEHQIVFGLTLFTDRPPGQFVGVVHADGQEACDEWCTAHEELIAGLRNG